MQTANIHTNVYPLHVLVLCTTQTFRVETKDHLILWPFVWPRLNLEKFVFLSENPVT